MEENSTTNLTMNNTLYGSLDSEENVPDPCPIFSHSLTACVVVCLGISLCGLAGNGMVMWFLGFHTKRSPFTVYILSLAVADFSLLLLFLLFLSPYLTITRYCKTLFPFINNYELYNLVLGYLCHLFYLSSLGLLTALSMERCVSILCPIWFRCHRPQHLSGIVSGALWALSGVFAFYFYVNEDSLSIIAGIALAISMAFSLMMLVSNLFLFLKLCCGSWRRQPGRLFVAILLNVLVFFAFGIPFCMEVFFNLPSSGRLYPGVATLFLAILNSSLRPVIYVLVGSCQRHRFHLSIRVALQRVFEEKDRSDEGSHGPEETVVEMRAL